MLTPTPKNRAQEPHPHWPAMVCAPGSHRRPAVRPLRVLLPPHATMHTGALHMEGG